MFEQTLTISHDSPLVGQTITSTTTEGRTITGTVIKTYGSVGVALAANGNVHVIEDGTPYTLN